MAATITRTNVRNRALRIFHARCADVFALKTYALNGEGHYFARR
jgi:hypothetical protein